MVATSAFGQDGYVVFGVDPKVMLWAKAAHRTARHIASDPEAQLAHLRHQKTWFVGVDALPNAADGAIEGTPLEGPWAQHGIAPNSWHPAQLSIVYPGYPGQDSDESDANHQYRIRRHAAHVDGLLPVGPTRRRYLLEPHAFILGLPLNETDAAPLMVWPGSHVLMGEAFRQIIGSQPPDKVDLTEGYQAARAEVFEQIEPRPVTAKPGQSILMHRHLVHGVAAWQDHDIAPAEGRMIAYFRPQVEVTDWLAPDP
ncbi:MAG: hypothetical protein ABJL67_23895 [Sulfitobacter sp.]